MKMEQTECSETSIYKIQMLGSYPEENIQHTEHGKSLKSRIICIYFSIVKRSNRLDSWPNCYYYKWLPCLRCGFGLPCLRCGFAAARWLGLWVRTSPGAWMSVMSVVLSNTERSLRRADHSSRGVLPSVVCTWVWSWSPIRGCHDTESVRSVVEKNKLVETAVFKGSVSIVIKHSIKYIRFGSKLPPSSVKVGSSFFSRNVCIVLSTFITIEKYLVNAANITLQNRCQKPMCYS
jgi:hypothetical protein